MLQYGFDQKPKCIVRRQTAMMKLSMGIDVGNSNCYVSCISAVGEIVLDGKKIETHDEKEWRGILESLSSRFDVQAAFEVGPHFEWLYDLLMEFCFNVEVINPNDYALICRLNKEDRRHRQHEDGRRPASRRTCPLYTSHARPSGRTDVWFPLSTSIVKL